MTSDVAVHSALAEGVQQLREAIRAATQEPEGAFNCAHRPHQLRRGRRILVDSCDLERREPSVRGRG